MNELAEVARILDAPSEEWHDIRAALEHALDEREALSRDVADLTGQVEVLEARVAELSPLADDGRAYRAALVDEALHEGVRAMGESFPEETYRDMLKEADIDGIRRVRDAFRAKADELFQAGRQSVTETEDDDTEASGPAPEMEFDTSVPARAYGAVA